MDGTRFDRLTRAVAVRLTRRSVLGGMAGAAAVGLSGGGGVRFAAAQGDLEERSIELYEAMAALAQSHAGSCADLTAKIQSFTDEHQDEIGQITVEQRGWDDDRKRTHVATYGDRRESATVGMESAAFRCRSAADPEPFPGLTGSASGSDATPVATPVAALGAMRSAKAVPARGLDCPDTTLMCTITNGINSNYPVGTQIGTISVGQCAQGVGGACNPCDQGNDNYAGTCSNDWGPCYSGQYPNGTYTCQGVAVSGGNTCDCSSTCSSVTTGECITFAASGLAGSDCASCWTSMCVSQATCETNCTSNECCNTACSEASPPPPPQGGDD